MLSRFPGSGRYWRPPRNANFHSCGMHGGTLTVVNFDDTYTHSVTSEDKDANGAPLFSVDVQPGGNTATDAS